jgi:hypothetical protein
LVRGDFGSVRNGRPKHGLDSIPERIARAFCDFAQALTPRFVRHPSEGTNGRWQPKRAHSQHSNVIDFFCCDASLPGISYGGVRGTLQSRSNRESDFY